MVSTKSSYKLLGADMNPQQQQQWNMQYQQWGGGMGQASATQASAPQASTPNASQPGNIPQANNNAASVAQMPANGNVSANGGGK